MAVGTDSDQFFYGTWVQHVTAKVSYNNCGAPGHESGNTIEYWEVWGLNSGNDNFAVGSGGANGLTFQPCGNFIETGESKFIWWDCKGGNSVCSKYAGSLSCCDTKPSNWDSGQLIAAANKQMRVKSCFCSRRKGIHNRRSYTITSKQK